MVSNDWRAHLEQMESFLGGCSVKVGAPKKPLGQKSFSEIALGPLFDSKAAMNAITAPPDGYQSFREVMFMGICGWMTSPRDSTYALLLMRHGVLDHFADLEGRSELRGLSVIQADYAVRYLLAGDDFLTDIFYPLGGHGAFSTSISREHLQDWHWGQADSIRKLATACGVLHFAQTHFSDNRKYHSISQQRAVAALTKLNKGKSVRSTLLKRWSENKSSLALLYAASTIKYGDQTLLDAVLSSAVKARNFLPASHQWLSRARYFCDTVLATLETDDEQYSANLTLLDSLEPMKFRPPKFSEEHESLIRSAFLRKMTAP